MLGGFTDLQHVPAEPVDRKFAFNPRVCARDFLHVGEAVRIGREVDVVAGPDAFAVPEHREATGSVDVLDDAGDVCLVTISGVEDNLPPTHEEIGLAQWRIGYPPHLRQRRRYGPVPHAAVTGDGQVPAGACPSIFSK